MASYFKVMQDGREVEFSFYLNNLVVRVPYTNGYFSLVGETSDADDIVPFRSKQYTLDKINTSIPTNYFSDIS
jgi:hypothetical protein